MKLCVFADCHIGQYGQKIDEESGLNARFVDGIGSLSFVIDDAAHNGAVEYLFAGDMFRNHKPSPTELWNVKMILPPRSMIAIPGNHDLPRSIGEDSAIVPLCDRDGRLFVSVVPQVLNRGDYQVATLPYPNRARLTASLPGYDKLSPQDADKLIGAHLESILRGLADQLDPSKPSVLLAHISIDSAELGAEQGIMAGKDITIPLHAIPEAFDFVVLGHIHKAQDFAAQGRPNVFYCGSTDRIDFGEALDVKSYALLNLDDMTWERVPIPCREYKTLYVKQDEDGVFRLDGDAHFTNGAICRVKITRPENAKPDYALIQGWAEEAGCWDFRGFIEDVERVASVRSTEIITAQTTEELLGVWHEAKSCEVLLPELVSATHELEGKVLV